MKNLFETPTFKVLTFIVKVMIVMALINFSFVLMNMASTPAFLLGIVMLIGTVGFFLEHIYRKYLKQSK
jgi:hypothetical protein